jgi:hypothetical protein
MGMDAREMTADMMTASRRLQLPAWQSGSSRPLKNAAGL